MKIRDRLIKKLEERLIKRQIINAGDGKVYEVQDSFNDKFNEGLQIAIQIIKEDGKQV